MKRSRFLQNIKFLLKRLRSPMCLKRCLRVFFFFSREEAGLHVRQQELPQCVFGPGSGGHSRTGPAAGSDGRSLGHITGAVSQHYIYASFPSEQVKMLSVEELVLQAHKWYNMTPLSQNLVVFCTLCTFACVTRVPRNQPIGMQPPDHLVNSD